MSDWTSYIVLPVSLIIVLEMFIYVVVKAP
jgi:hypothetical protein